MFVRPIRQDDLGLLLELTRSAGVGLTTLPASEELLGRRIAASCAALDAEPRPENTSLLFALENPCDARVVGICGLEGAVGITEPWYNYRVGLAVHSSRELGIYRKLQTLFLTNDLTGSTELCSLFLHADYRHSNNGGLLSKSRFLFLAEFPERFDRRVIVEMRGVSDAAGRSPFWESLGRHFFKMEFSEADYLTGSGQKSFIAELMPKHPLYAEFLSEEARAAIGQVHENTRPALATLSGEGFRYQGYIDIFDGGPTIECELADIRAVRDSRILTAVPSAGMGEGRLWLVSNRRLHGYRACLARTDPTGTELPLGAEVLARLELTPGDSVRAVPLSAKERPE